ncbi:MAG: COX15/CtaA family protein [Myxococcaceae bacterium]
MRLYRYAVACAVATFALTIFGGLVSATDSGLACPDWPLCEGKFIPQMINGKQFEHTHRLVASFVMVMTFGLAALLFKYRRQDSLLWKLGFAASGLVIVQALFGALTVILKLPWQVSTTHLAIANLFFVLMVSLAFLTRQRMEPRVRSEHEWKLSRAVLPVAGLVYLQVVAGGAMRHLRAGLACGFDIPYCNGALWATEGGVPVQAHLVHRFLGVIAGLAVLWLAVKVLRSPARTAMKALAVVASVAVVLQVTLGILTVLRSRELYTMSVHSSLGMLLLAAMVSLYWLAAPSSAPEKLHGGNVAPSPGLRPPSPVGEGVPGVPA